MDFQFNVTVIGRLREDGTKFFVATVRPNGCGGIYVTDGSGSTKDLALERLRSNISQALEEIRLRTIEELTLSVRVD